MSPERLARIRQDLDSYDHEEHVLLPREDVQCLVDLANDYRPAPLQGTQDALLRLREAMLGLLCHPFGPGDQAPLFYPLWEMGAWSVPFEYVKFDGSFDRPKWDRNWFASGSDEGQDYDSFVAILKAGGSAFEEDGTPLEDSPVVKNLRLALSSSTLQAVGWSYDMEAAPLDTQEAIIELSVIHQAKPLKIDGYRGYSSFYACGQGLRVEPYAWRRRDKTPAAPLPVSDKGGPR